MLTATHSVYDFMTNFMTNGGIDMPTYAELRHAKKRWKRFVFRQTPNN